MLGNTFQTKSYESHREKGSLHVHLIICMFLIFVIQLDSSTCHVLVSTLYQIIHVYAYCMLAKQCYKDN